MSTLETPVAESIAKAEADILALLNSLHQAHHDKDAAAIAAVYASDATVFNLAPPLTHSGVNLAEKQAWLDSWSTPITLEARDVSITVSGDLAFCHCFLRMAGTKKGPERSTSVSGCAKPSALSAAAPDGSSSTSTPPSRFTWMEACARPSICNPEFLFALTIDAGAGMENRDRLAHRRWNLLRQSWVTASLPHRIESTGAASSSLSLAEPVRSSCRMLSYHPDHSLTLPRMKREEIRHIVDSWIGEIIEQGNSNWVQYVQIAENSGAVTGAANPHPHPHPHAEIWSTASVPAEPAAETRSQREHLARTGRCLLCDYVAAERAAGQRIVFENDHFIALVPWWAASPFEVLLISRRHARALPELHRSERDGLADALKSLTTRYDNLFETSLAYAMDFHQAPVLLPGLLSSYN